MKILLIVAYFVPEIGSASHVYFDLARAFVKKGHEVHVITSYPREFNLEEHDKNKNFPLDEIMNSIHVHRCKHPTQRDNFLLRGLEHFILPLYYFSKYKYLKITFDVCLMYIPPLPLYYLAKKIKKYDSTPSVLNFQDFHPQELTDVKVLKNPLIIKILEHIEKKAYKHADFITVLSKKGVDYVVQRGGDPTRIQHIYNSIQMDNIDEKNIRKDFKKKQKIEDKTLVTYAGILSPYQGIDTILDVAKRMQNNNDDIIFYIVGDGSERMHLAKRINDEVISNVSLLPFQKRDDYFDIINSSDIALVTLDKRMKAPCLPGKIKDLLALQKPIIACVSKDTETADFLSQTHAGIVSEPDNIEELYKSILMVKNNEKLKKEMGREGYKFLEENMTLEKNIERYEEILKKLI